MAKTDLVIKFPNKISRKHFMLWLSSTDIVLRYENYMDDIELDDLKTKRLTIRSWGFNIEKGVCTTDVGRMTDLRAVNLS